MTMTEKTELAIVGAALLVVLYITKRVGDAAGAGVDAAASGIANAWISLTMSPPIQVLGSVRFPDGSLVPLSSLTVKTDKTGGVFTMRGGHLFKLMPHDDSGNWPAAQVM